MVVACDLSKRVYGFVDGQVAWQWDDSLWSRALALFEGLVFIGTGTSIIAANPRTGYFHRVMTVPNAPSDIVGLSITEFDGDIWVVCCFDGGGPGTVRGYRMQHLDLTEIFVNPIPAQYPRHAEMAGGWIFVCETFGHRVYTVTTYGSERESTDVYYPNYVQTLNGGAQALITAEHENRIIRWDYTATPETSLEMAAPVAPFNDPLKTKDDIIAEDAGTSDPNSPYDPKKSLCAKESAGSVTLYSPNSARLYGDDLLISDTDNHRVIIHRNGQIVTEVTGFNNPVTAVLI